MTKKNDKIIGKIKSPLFFSMILASSCSTEIKPAAGLVEIYCSEADLTSVKGVSIRTSLNQKWDDSVDYQGDISGERDVNLVVPLGGDASIWKPKTLVLTILKNHN